MLELLLITVSLFTETQLEPSNGYHCQQAISHDAPMHDLVDNGCTDA